MREGQSFSFYDQQQQDHSEYTILVALSPFSKALAESSLLCVGSLAFGSKITHLLPSFQTVKARSLHARWHHSNAPPFSYGLQNFQRALERGRRIFHPSNIRAVMPHQVSPKSVRIVTKLVHSRVNDLPQGGIFESDNAVNCK